MITNCFGTTAPATARRRRASPLAFLALAILLAGSAAAAPDAAHAAQRLLDAFKDGTAEEERIDALAEAKGVLDPRVVALVADALRDRSVTVRRGAIDALGAIDDPEALQQLHRLYGRDEKLRKDEETFVRLLRAIGRKGQPSSVAILVDDVFDQVTVRTATARIQGLGRIRTDESLAALFELTTKAGGRSPRRSRAGEDSGTPVDRALRLSIAVLSGQELEVDRAVWQRWWSENRKTFHVEKERPVLSASLVAQWEQYWGERYYAGQAPPPAPLLGPPVAIDVNPARDDVDEAVAALREAFSPGEAAMTRVVAISTYGGLADDDVVALVARGLTDPDDEVRLTAIDTLGWLPRPDALKRLHRLYRRDTKLREDEVLFSRLLQAIGRHGDRSSLEVLKDHPFDHLTLASGKARILGIARIRDPRSFGLLVRGMRLAGGDPRGGRSGSPRFMDDFAVGFSVLTGEELGPLAAEWEAWGRANPDFVPGAARPALSAPLRAAWEEYWNEAY